MKLQIYDDAVSETISIVVNCLSYINRRKERGCIVLKDLVHTNTSTVFNKYTTLEVSDWLEDSSCRHEDRWLNLQNSIVRPWLWLTKFIIQYEAMAHRNFLRRHRFGDHIDFRFLKLDFGVNNVRALTFWTSSFVC